MPTIRNLLVVTLFLVGLDPIFGQEDVSVKTIADIQRAIVPIVCAYQDEQRNFQVVDAAGTGFFVDLNGRFVTAGHVLDASGEISRTKHQCFPAIYIPNHSWETLEEAVGITYFPFANCSRDSDIDLAICEPRQNPFRTVSRINIGVVDFDTTIQPIGTPVAFSGFPLEFIRPITSKGDVAGRVPRGPFSNVFDYLVDRTAWPGASGSPLYLANGKVIGIILAIGVNQASGLSWARSAPHIVDFIKKHPPNN